MFTLFAGVLLHGCGQGPEVTPGASPAEVEVERSGSPNAKLDIVEMLRADRTAVRSAADQGGRAWLEGDATARVSTPGNWRIVYEVGPLGIAPGGAVYLQVSAFWGWDSPQSADPEGPGYTRVEVSREGVATGRAGESLAPGLMVVALPEGLSPGDVVTFDYGAGPFGARADLYAESDSRFWIAVDGDGDGVRAVLPDSPGVRVLPGAAERVSVVVPSTARPGDRTRVTVALLDRTGNRATESTATVTLRSVPEGIALPSSLTLDEADRGARTLDVEAPRTTGTWRIAATVELEEPAHALSNPLRVARDGPRILWADLHGHSALSDGTGEPEEWLAYARDVAGLDVVALTDHDHYGMLPIAQRSELWERLRRATEEANSPDRFVTILGFEWTNWQFGHRHVLYFDGEGEVFDALAEDCDEPTELWARLRGREALTIAHHSAGEPVATDWSVMPDPVLEPVTEVTSVHGSSEAEDSPQRIRGFVPGNSVRDILDRGARLGLIGSGDSHDGHPGLPHLDPTYGWRPDSRRGPQRMGTGGVAAIFAEQCTREAVLEALRERRVYATNGPRILLETELDGSAPMGSVLRGAREEALYCVEVEGTAALRELVLVRSGEVVRRVSGSGTHVRAEFDLRALVPGEYLYVRVEQEDGGLAWSSPTWIEAED